MRQRVLSRPDDGNVDAVALERSRYHFRFRGGSRLLAIIDCLRLPVAPGFRHLASACLPASSRLQKRRLLLPPACRADDDSRTKTQL